MQEKLLTGPVAVNSTVAAVPPPEITTPLLIRCAEHAVGSRVTRNLRITDTESRAVMTVALML